MLIDCGGPDAEEVKAFFHLHQLAQACATCLVLACSRNPGDAQVSFSGFLLIEGNWIKAVADLPTRPYLPVLVRKSAGNTAVFFKIRTPEFPESTEISM